MRQSILTDSQRAEFRPHFEKMGLRQVKAELKSGTFFFGGATERIAAEEWVEEIEAATKATAESLRDARSERALLTSRSALKAQIVTAIFSTIIAIIALISKAKEIREAWSWLTSVHP